MTRLRNYFLTGFIVCAPLAITVYLAWSFIGWVDSWVKPYIPAATIPDNYLPFAVPGLRPDHRAAADHADRLSHGQHHRPHHRLASASGCSTACRWCAASTGAEADFRDGAVEQERDVPHGRPGRISAQGRLVAGLRRRREIHRDQREARRGRRSDGRRLHAVHAQSRRPAS